MSTLSYQLDGLEGGKSYRFTSYHRLWWNNEMPIKITITYTLNGESAHNTLIILHCFFYIFTYTNGLALFIIHSSKNL